MLKRLERVTIFLSAIIFISERAVSAIMDMLKARVDVAIAI